MTVAELIEHLSELPCGTLVLYRGSLDVLVPLEFDRVTFVERAHYEGQDDRPAESRAWFDPDMLTDRLHKIKHTESARALILMREKTT